MGYCILKSEEPMPVKPPAPAVIGILTVLPGGAVALPIIIFVPIAPLPQAKSVVRTIQVVNTVFKIPLLI